MTSPGRRQKFLKQAPKNPNEEKNEEEAAREDSVRCLPHKIEGLSLIPRTQVKSQLW